MFITWRQYAPKEDNNLLGTAIRGKETSVLGLTSNSEKVCAAVCLVLEECTYPFSIIVY